MKYQIPQRLYPWTGALVNPQSCGVARQMAKGGFCQIPESLSYIIMLINGVFRG